MQVFAASRLHVPMATYPRNHINTVNVNMNTLNPSLTNNHNTAFMATTPTPVSSPTTTMSTNTSTIAAGTATVALNYYPTQLTTANNTVTIANVLPTPISSYSLPMNTTSSIPNNNMNINTNNNTTINNALIASSMAIPSSISTAAIRLPSNAAAAAATPAVSITPIPVGLTMLNVPTMSPQSLPVTSISANSNMPVSLYPSTNSSPILTSTNPSPQIGGIGSPASSGSGDKSKRRLARKAELARLSRKRKKAYITELEEKVRCLVRQVNDLKDCNRRGTAYTGPDYTNGISGLTSVNSSSSLNSYLMNDGTDDSVGDDDTDETAPVDVSMQSMNAIIELSDDRPMKRMKRVGSNNGFSDVGSVSPTSSASVSESEDVPALTRAVSGSSEHGDGFAGLSKESLAKSILTEACQTGIISCF